MSAFTSITYLQGLVRELQKLPRETEWVEFKVDNDDPQSIGEYISALSNSAALVGKTHGYLVWGIRNEDHALVGTTFDPAAARKGNEELENWLFRMLSPHVDFRFGPIDVDGARLVLLEVPAAARHPVRFSGTEYIRVGSYKKPLKEFPEKERALWQRFDRVTFEAGVALGRLNDEDVLRLLDFPAYFDLLEAPLPDGRAAILDALEKDRLVARSTGGGWDITNLGGVLFAKRLSDFPSLARKPMRIIQYLGRGRIETVREHLFDEGYATGFQRLLGYVNGLLPVNEQVGQALRRSVPMYPELALRELVANALIHQDFSATGSGPMIELFDGRIEITNPGESLVEPDRLLDCPPTSRNETLASLMRRFRICEERGSGIDKVIAQVELFQLPPPLFERPPGFTRVVLFAPRPFAEMTKDERIRACYWHACLRYVQRDYVTNTTVRARFSIDDRNAATASRLIKDAIDAGFIVAYDPDVPRNQLRYVPWWAKSATPSGSAP